MGRNLRIGALFIFLWFSPVFSLTYQESLDLADRNITLMKYAEAMDFLQTARELRPSPDSRYFNLMGEIFYRMENYFDSEMAFQESLKLNPEQPGLYDHLFQYYQYDRKPARALEMVNRYLDYFPESKKHLYQAAVLCYQINQPEEAQKYIDILNDDRRFFQEKDPILEEMAELIEREKWNQATINAEKFILYFPDNTLLHEFRIMAHKGKESTPEFKNSRRPDRTTPNFENKIIYPNENIFTNYERSLIEASFIFKEDTRFTIRYGNFLQEQGRNYEALQAYRRALRIALASKPKDSWKEILFLLGNIYQKLGREKDKLAINAIQKLLKKDTLSDSELDQALKTHSKNLEIKDIAIVLSNDNPEKVSTYTALRSKLEEELSEKELLRVVGPYATEGVQ